jgi:hypothetical protein
MAYGGGVMSRTLNKMVMPGSHLFTMSRSMLAAFGAYVILVLVLAVSTGFLVLPLYAAATASCVVLWYLLLKALRQVVEKVDYHNLGTLPEKESAISWFIASAASLGLIMVVNVALMYGIYWPAVVIITLGYVLVFIVLMMVVYNRTCDHDAYAQIRQRAFEAPVTVELEKPQFNHRQRWKGL